MSNSASCLYFGEVVHQRFAPRRHRLRYRMFQGLFDLDELPSLGRKLRLFSHNRANVFSFYDSDHGDATGAALRPYVEDLLSRAGLAVDGGAITVLCMPRIFGFVFNPLSIFYCHGRDGGLIALLYEVNNTFGQRHSYLIPVEPSDCTIVRQTCTKNFYVSPFMDMEMIYRFKINFPGARLATSIDGSHAGGAPVIFASFTGVRRELSDGALLSAIVTYPLMTLGVVAAIHWEAVKLLAKGLRLRRRPPPPQSVTIVEAAGSNPNNQRRAEAPGPLHKLDKQSA